MREQRNPDPAIRGQHARGEARLSADLQTGASGVATAAAPAPLVVCGQGDYRTNGNGRLLDDDASRAIAAHTTPGKGDSSLDIEAQIAEQAMRRLSAKLEAEFGCRDANFTMSGTGRILLSCPDRQVHEFGDTIAQAIAAVRAKLGASRCKCPACGRAGV